MSDNIDVGSFIIKAGVFCVFLSLALPWAKAGDYAPGEVIVRFKDGRSSLSSASTMGRAQKVQSIVQKSFFTSIGVSHYKINSGFTVEKAVEAFSKDPNVEFAEPNYYVTHASLEAQKLSQEELFDLVEQQDLLPTRAHLNSQSKNQAYHQKVVSQSQSSSHVPIIAIIDSGVDLTHPAFVQTGALWVNTEEVPGNKIDDDGNGFVDDVNGWNFLEGNNNVHDGHGHGTHVAGIVLKSDAAINIMGAPYGQARVKIMPIKFLDDEDGKGRISDAIKGIDYALKNGARILNNSWGTYESSQALKEAVAKSSEQGAIFVVAAGNHGANNDTKPTYPAGYEFSNIISVAATTSSDWLAKFSNFGEKSVHIGGLGSRVVSTYTNHIYASLSGTSMAAPFVAGLAGLVLAENPEMNVKAVKELIFNSSDHLSSLSRKVMTEGRLNSQVTIDSLLQRNPSSDTTTTTPKSDFVVEPNPKNPEEEENPEDETKKIGDKSSFNQSGTGCGMVQWGSLLGGGASGGSSFKNSSSYFYISIMLALLFAPILWAFYLSRSYRSKEMANNLRNDKRYSVQIPVLIHIGSQSILGSMKNLSASGLQLCSRALSVEKGKTVVVNVLSSHEGNKKVELKGKVVWSENKKEYGIQFFDETSSLLLDYFFFQKIIADEPN